MALRLHFRDHGSGEPLIILHGLFGSLDNWETLARRLGTSWRVLTVDQRNHGRSPHADAHSYPALADDLAAFIAEHRLAPVHLVGHSMGGKTAMRFALDRPEQVRSLIVVDIASRTYGRHHDHVFDALCELDLSLFTTRREVDEALAPSLPSPAVRQVLLKNLRRNDDGMFGWKMNLPAIRRRYDEMLAAIDGDRPFEKPALVIRGTRADYVADSDLPALRRLFPAVEVGEIDAGHWVHAEAPEEFAAMVESFLRRHS